MAAVRAFYSAERLAPPIPLRILIPHTAGGGNLYIEELARAYAEQGHEVVLGSENLLLRQHRPDLVHLHWPEELYRWRGEGSPGARVQRFEAALEALRTDGIPLALTVHNLVPHDHTSDPLDRRVYQRVAAQARVIHHHCPHSQQAFESQYAVATGARQVVVPHGHYGGYPDNVDRSQARQRLGIGEDRFVFLQFGQVRGYKGLSLLLQAFGQTRVPRKLLLVAGQYQRPSGATGALERARLALRKRWPGDLVLHGRAISIEEVQLYLRAADCVVMSHRAGLNSGVAVLGMTFGRVVVGPDLGCMGWVLGQGRNLTYQAGNATGMARAMEQVARYSAEQRQVDGEANVIAAKRWQWSQIASSVLDAM